MKRALQKWQKAEEPRLDESDVLTLTKKLSRPYTIYGSMLLLSLNGIQDEEAKQVFKKTGLDLEKKLLESIAKEMKITHIAVNHPIPLSSYSSDGSAVHENTIRAPINFLPVYGDFGPTTCLSPPSKSDYEQAFWVNAKQNGIFQVWAPRWTMFSRGNISEKARLLTLPSVLQTVETGPSTAVDLYAGIGYFAFSYLAAGVEKVLCWELNGWSCEGIRKGARANKWKLGVEEELLRQESASRVFMFNESNEEASGKIDKYREYLPPIRHVNCGLLPSSKQSWPIAIKALDPQQGGWIHVHENFAQQEIEQRALEVCDALRHLLKTSASRCSNVVLDDIHRVKTYAPGVWHCVLDVHICHELTLDDPERLATWAEDQLLDVRRVPTTEA